MFQKTFQEKNGDKENHMNDKNGENSDRNDSLCWMPKILKILENFDHSKSYQFQQEMVYQQKISILEVP